MRLGSMLFAVLVSLPVTAFIWFTTTVEDPPEADPLFYPRGDPLLSPDPQVRVEAEAAVLRRGLGGKSLIPNPDRIPDPLERERILSLIERLDAKIAKATTLGSVVSRDWFVDPPNPVSVPFVAFTRQTGNQLRLRDDQTDHLVTFDASDRLFWEAVDEVAEQADLTVAEETSASMFEESTITFRDRTEDDAAVSIAYSGPVRFLASQISIVTTPDGDRFLRLPLAARFEPRLQPIDIASRAEDLLLTNANGDALPLTLPDGIATGRFGEGRRQTNVTLESQAPRDRWVAPFQLTGRFSARLTKDGEPFLIPMTRSNLSQESFRYGTLRFREFNVAADGTADVTIEIVRSDDHESLPVVFHAVALSYTNSLFTKIVESPGIEEPRQCGGSDGEELHRFRFENFVVPPDFTSVSLSGSLAYEFIELPLTLQLTGLQISDATDDRDAVAPLNAGSGGVP